MKKIIFLAVLFFSNYSFANQNTFSCIFSFSEYLNNKTPIGNKLVEIMHLNEFKIHAEFISKSKTKWKINKLFLEKDIKKTLNKTFEELVESFTKIVFKQKLSSNDKYFRDFFLKQINLSVEDFNNLLENLSKKEKNEMIRNYENDLNLFYDEFGEAIEDITTNQEEHFNHYISNFDNYGEIKVKGNKIEAKTVTDSGMLIENIIDYKMLLKNESKNAVSLKMTFVDRNSALFTSECVNTTNVTKKIETKDSNDFTVKLRKLKNMFEEELITQEEYDAKRKEILDEM